MLFEIVEKDAQLDHADTGLLDLCVGASVARSSRKRPVAAMDGEPEEGPPKGQHRRGTQKVAASTSGRTSSYRRLSTAKVKKVKYQM